jgi:hypothetical protein
MISRRHRRFANMLASLSALCVSFWSNRLFLITATRSDQKKLLFFSHHFNLSARIRAFGRSFIYAGVLLFRALSADRRFRPGRIDERIPIRLR